MTLAVKALDSNRTTSLVLQVATFQICIKFGNIDRGGAGGVAVTRDGRRVVGGRVVDGVEGAGVERI